MKKTFLIVSTLLLVIILGACQNKKEDENKIIVGASYAPHAEILEQAKPLLKVKGYDLEIVKFQDYIFPNQNLTEGALDANYFQHIPNITKYNEHYNTEIVSAGNIHLEPIGVYSKTFDSLEAITNGATVIMSNNSSEEARLISILVDIGLIVLKDGLTPNDIELKDIEKYLASNPKNLTFRNNIDPGLLVKTYKTEDNVIVLINTNFALDGNMNPKEDAIAMEDETNNPYYNVIAVNKGDETDPKILALVEVLKSDEIKQFMLEEYKGAVIPVE